jgi:hypothetical protein
MDAFHALTVAPTDEISLSSNFRKSARELEMSRLPAETDGAKYPPGYLFNNAGWASAGTRHFAGYRIPVIGSGCGRK